MKKWDIIGKLKRRKEKGKIDEVISVLLENRGLKTKKEVEGFLHPKLEKVTVESVGIDKKQLAKAIARIKKAIEKQEQIVVYGDYDVDGICGSAILWETLHGLGAKVLPYIPHRIEEGYGLSMVGIQNLVRQLADQNVKLIVTVDNGIVANEAVDFANKNGIDVIITDHHVPAKKLPKAYAIVHTTKLCGTGVAYLLAQEISNFPSGRGSGRGQFPISNKYQEDNHLELVALATIADLVPLVDANRTLTKFGLEMLKKTKRVGLRALFKEAGLIDQASTYEVGRLGTYEVGHIIAPRLNAMGRLKSAMDSLRLLCTKDPKRGEMLAHKLGSTNRERQLVTEETVLHAKLEVKSKKLEVRKLLFVVHEAYQQGIIGLVAGRLVEEFYRPAIVIAKGEKYSKASARSVAGFNIIEFIRSASEHLVDVGGHPMAAGFTVETEKLLLLQKTLEDLAEKTVNGEHLTRMLRIDCEIALSNITGELYEQISQLEPFGMNNPQPTFVTRNVVIEEMRLVGQDGRHMKLRLVAPRHSGLLALNITEGSRIRSDSGVANAPQNDEVVIFDAIAFGFGQRASEFHIGDAVDIVYTIDEDRWNGNKRLQLKLKDLRK